MKTVLRHMKCVSSKDHVGAAIDVVVIGTCVVTYVDATWWLEPSPICAGVVLSPMALGTDMN